MSHYGNTIQTVNEMGKRQVDKLSLFYMPHCSFNLYVFCVSANSIITTRYNAVIWSNWGTNLQNVIIIGNSFSRYESTSITEEQRNSPSNCIFRLLPKWQEVPLMETISKSDSFRLKFLFEAFHTICIMRLKEGENGNDLEERPPEPECGKDVLQTVNSSLLEYMEKMEEKEEKEEKEESNVWNCLFIYTFT